MKTYVINLDRRPDRLAHMRQQLGAVAFERVVAIDGADAPETTNGLTRFELACLGSHRIAWERFLEGSDPFACFLEDDVHLSSDFPAFVRNDGWVPREAHSVKLDTYFQKVKLGENRAALGSRQLAPLYTRHESAAAYVLTRLGAERYLELTTRPVLPTDYALFPKTPRKLGLRIFQLAPALAVQDHLRPADEGGQRFTSSMTGGRSQSRRRLSSGAISRESTRLIEQIADLKEAIYLGIFLKPRTATVAVG
jgi:glycosyl transferase family 25